MDDEIFAETLRWLRFHIWPALGDTTPLDAFNRLLAKNVRPDGWEPTHRFAVTPEQIESRREYWTTSALARIARAHDRARPRNTECPIIIAVYDGTERLLDGNTRINYWVQSGNVERHQVNIHVVVGDG